VAQAVQLSVLEKAVKRQLLSQQSHLLKLNQHLRLLHGVSLLHLLRGLYHPLQG
jgi:hypothetical protein